MLTMNLALFICYLCSTALASPNIGKLGFYLSALRNIDGQCKDENNYRNEIDALKSYGTDIVKIPSATDCDMLSLIGGSIESNAMELIVNVWADTPSHFQAEKRALTRDLGNLSVNDVAEFTVSVGKLNSSDITPNQLASLVSDLRTHIGSLTDKNNQSYSQVPVGITSSWKTIIDPGNWPALEASDSLTIHSFPYLDGNGVNDSSLALMDAVEHTLLIYQLVKNDTNVPFYVGGTGWPTDGPSVGDATPSLQKASDYWQSSVCSLRLLGVNVVVYEAFDEKWRSDDVDRHWGVFDANNEPKYQISKCLAPGEEEEEE